MRSFYLKPGDVKQFIWWLFFLICAFYGAYAVYMGVVELFSLLGIVENAPHREAPFMFIMHALSGSVVLIGGALQFNQRILDKKRNIHRVIGRIYIGAIWMASIGGFWNAIVFKVDIPAKTVFAVLSILWFGTTTLAWLRIRQRRIKAHREWMIRSFALSLFFVTFSFWVPGLAGTNIPEAVGYPLAVFLSWSLNLLVAELWIRYTRLIFTKLSAVANLDYRLQRTRS